MLVMGIGNGSLYDPTVLLFESVGASFVLQGRKFRIAVNGIKLIKEAVIMRPGDIPEAVADGVLDFGICGWDQVAEKQMEDSVIKVVELPYGKKTRAAVRVVVIGKNEKFVDRPDILVAAEYPNIAKKIFKKAKIRRSDGGTEQKLDLGKYSFGVCVTETGKSIRENGLKIVRVILESPVVLIAQKLTPQIQLLGDLLLGALNAEKYLLIKMNVEKRFYGRIINSIPALKSPTVSRLLRGGYAIEAVVKKDSIADLIILLCRKGATDVLTTDICRFLDC